MICPAVLLVALGASAADLDEFKVKREEVFEFAQRPQVARDGDKVTIRFASKGYCDATMAIEDEQGRIVRYLASGVLGPNAPDPFQKNSAGLSPVFWGLAVDRAGRILVTVRGGTVVCLGKEGL